MFASSCPLVAFQFVVLSLKQGLQTMAQRPKFSSPLVVVNKCLLGAVMLIYLHIVYRCFHIPASDLSSSNAVYCKAKALLLEPLQEKCADFDFSPLTRIKLGSYYLCPHNKKKADQTERQWLFLDSSENWGHRANHHSEIWRGGPNREWQPSPASWKQNRLEYLNGKFGKLLGTKGGWLES